MYIYIYIYIHYTRERIYWGIEFQQQTLSKGMREELYNRRNLAQDKCGPSEGGFLNNILFS